MRTDGPPERQLQRRVAPLADELARLGQKGRRLVACNSEIGSRCPRETRRAAALRMLAMPMGIAVLRALHHTPPRAVLDSHFTVTGHESPR
jgi:hypothetical protein